MIRSKFTFLVLVFTGLVSVGVEAADAPWHNLVTTPQQAREICNIHGTVSKECLAVIGIPQALGQVACVGKIADHTTYQYHLGWHATPDGYLHVYMGETELSLPAAARPNQPVIAWVRPRVQGTIGVEDVQKPSARQYLIAFENGHKDLPGIVVGLPERAILRINVDEANKPLGAEILGVKFDCIATRT